ncbi:MAG: PP2C family protein-serine/threonine phosphatase [Bernardetiaceae bacterium]
MSLSLEDQLQMRELELNDLFEIIRAINSNATEDNLYRIYKFTLSSNPTIDKLALCVRENEAAEWVCKVSFGAAYPTEGQVLERDLSQITQTPDGRIPDFAEFETIIPIRHKNKVLAQVLLAPPKDSTTVKALDINFLDTLSNIIIVAVENKKLARKQKKQEALRRQLEIAKDVQNLLFPKALPYNDRLKVAANYHPHHTVGGDYYDFISIDADRFLICVADVSGKGVPAAILMSNFQAALRVMVHHTNDLRTIVEQLNRLIIQNSGGGSFITAFFAIYDFKTYSLTYINAGHNPPFLFRGNSDEVQFLSEGTTIIGGFDPLPFLNLSTINNLNRFLLFCFTDGFTETYNEAGEELGEDNLCQYVKDNLQLPPKLLHEQLLSYLNKFKGDAKLADDVTLISCRVDATA